VCRSLDKLGRANEKYSTGSQFQSGDGSTKLRNVVLVFPTVSQAKAYSAVYDQPGAKECFNYQVNKAASANNGTVEFSDFEVSSATLTALSPEQQKAGSFDQGGGFQAVVHFPGSDTFLQSGVFRTGRAVTKLDVIYSSQLDLFYPSSPYLVVISVGRLKQQLGGGSAAKTEALTCPKSGGKAQAAGFDPAQMTALLDHTLKAAGAGYTVNPASTCPEKFDPSTPQGKYAAANGIVGHGSRFLYGTNQPLPHVVFDNQYKSPALAKKAWEASQARVTSVSYPEGTGAPTGFENRKVKNTTVTFYEQTGQATQGQAKLNYTTAAGVFVDGRNMVQFEVENTDAAKAHSDLQTWIAKYLS